MRLIIEWLIKALVILATAYLIPGFHVNSFGGAFVLVLVLTLLNILVKPLLILLTLPINIMTLGIFTLIINAIVLQLAVGIVPGISSDSFATTFLASIIMSLLSAAAGMLERK